MSSANLDFPKPTKKVSLQDFLQFAQEYFHTSFYVNQRFGQAFFNAFEMDGSDPEVFYSENVRRTTERIMRRYVKTD